MQEHDDLKNIFDATHEIGTFFQNELVKLHEKNSQLAEENARLHVEIEKLNEEIKTLNTKVINLVEENNNLTDDLKSTVKNLRNEILEELNNNFTFQNEALRKIRECVDGTAIYETPKENSPVINEENTEQNSDKPTAYN